MMCFSGFSISTTRFSSRHILLSSSANSRRRPKFPEYVHVYWRKSKRLREKLRQFHMRQFGFLGNSTVVFPQIQESITNLRKPAENQNVVHPSNIQCLSQLLPKDLGPELYSTTDHSADEVSACRGQLVDKRPLKKCRRLDVNSTE